MPDQPTKPMPNDANPETEWENPWGPALPTLNDYEQIRQHVRRQAELLPPASRASGLETLQEVLAAIKQADEDYPARYPLVILAMSLAIQVGYPVGVRIDPGAPEWPVIYIELPTGQVSWHMPQHQSNWDGHDTDEKYRRISAFIERNAT